MGINPLAIQNNFAFFIEYKKFLFFDQRLFGSIGIKNLTTILFTRINISIGPVGVNFFRKILRILEIGSHNIL